MENTKVGFTCGFIGGFGKFLLQVNSHTYLTNLAGAVLTAVICGAAGVAGKELYQYLKRKLKSK